MERGEDVFYYLTVMNENYAQPSMPDGAYDEIIRGMHRIEAWAGPVSPSAPREEKKRVRLLGSGAIMMEVVAAADLLRTEWSIDVETWSVTSFSELARDAQTAERWNMLHPADAPQTSHVETCLAGDELTVAATDYVRAYPRLIAPYVSGDFVVLGTDGFGRSDTRAELRRFFEVDRYAVVIATLHALAKRGAIATTIVSDAIARYNVDAATKPSWER
jgi:pyruvate dehydrogenase E1 component